MIVVKFELIDGSYVGMIDTLNGSIATTIHPQERGPDYPVSSAESTGEFGAAWKRTNRERKPYLAVRLDSPFLAATVNAALIEQDDGTHVLVWSRTRRTASRLVHGAVRGAGGPFSSTSGGSGHDETQSRFSRKKFER